MSKRGVIILVLVVLFGVYFFVVGYEFLEKENALWQKKVKVAKEEQRRCEARLSKFRNFDQFRTSIRLPYASDLPLESWTRHFDTLRAGMSESEVEIIMGAPDYVRCAVSEKGDKFMGSTWHYEVTVPQDVANNGQNTSFQVVFGPDGKVQDKRELNMQPRPSPTPTASATPAPSATPASSPSPSATATPAASPSAIPGASATPAASGTPTSANPAASPQQSAPGAMASPTPQ